MKDKDLTTIKKKNYPKVNMRIFNKIDDLIHYLNVFRRENKRIGFVPTMGALHDGHLSLIRKAGNENDLVVVSIFVNPTQFNNPEDLKNYPRTIEEDLKKLDTTKADVIFNPDENEMYNSNRKFRIPYTPAKIAEVMEGEFRPGHFQGVVQIVSILFQIVNPDRSYFGEKDFQQLAVIRQMVKDEKFRSEIIGCTTVREQNGLAMSSRNMKLSKDGFENAADISKALNYIRDNWKKHKPEELKKIAVDMVNSNPLLKVEYIEIADETDLKKVKSWDEHEHVRCFAAVFCEGVRLIDNVRVF